MGSSGILKGTSCYVGGPGIIAAPIQRALGETDLVLALGTRFGLSLAFDRAPIWPTSLSVIQVDIDPAEIGKNHPVSLGILGDCKSVLQQMLQMVKKQKAKVEQEGDWLKSLKAARDKYWASK